MLQAIDHLVIAVPDPHAAARELEERLGIAFTSGGRHPGAGTYNRIAFLGEPYLELIGIEDAALASQKPIGAAALRALEANPSGGLATFALLDEELEATVTLLQGSGSSIGSPAHGSRETGDGETVEWWTAAFARLGPEDPPFLIRHARSGAEWSQEAIDSRRTLPQPAGCVMGLARLELAVPDPGAAAGLYSSQLGLPIEALGGDRVAHIGPHTVLLKPSRAGETAATVLITCGEQPARTLDRFGIRFELRPPPTS
ncbi:MAG TPA: VOC family protein [Candidatus Limnocylindria bacterium]|jgi:hypothetical protein|nr:VOC family protein [Candidatus Limnocylindria bacterium]